MLKVGIIGGGSIGLLLACYFDKAKLEVTLYTRTEEQAVTINEEGIRLIKDSTASIHFVKAVSMTSVEFLDEAVIIVAVKQYQLDAVFHKLNEITFSSSSIVFLQNGMGHLTMLDKLPRQFSAILIGIVEHGALRERLNIVHHTGDGEMKLGFYKGDMPSLNTLIEKLTNEGLLTSIHEDWLVKMEKKLLVNSLINPLTAIYGVTNGKLVLNKHYQFVMRLLFEEFAMLYQVTEQDWEYVLLICKKTANNRSSMLKDIELGRPTEVDSITGIILTKAKERGIRLPLHTFMLESIKGIEITRKEGAHK